MRKLLSLAIALSINVAAFAQRTAHSPATAVSGINGIGYGITKATSNERTTAVGDTVALTNIAAADTPLVMYSIPGGGYLTGTDSFGDQGFAERYDIDVAADDSSLVIIGVVAEFHGVVNPLSAHTVSFNAWSVGVPSAISATYGYSGFPGTLLDSVVVPFNQLGIGAAADTIKAYLFPVVTGTVQNSFFVGYTMIYNYSSLAGDTIGLACSMNGDRTSSIYSVASYVDSVLDTVTSTYVADTVYDTTINIQNATQWSDGVWHDNYTDNDSLYNDLAIYPIVVIGNPTGVKGVTKNNFTFFGCFPNPAQNSTNIRFSLLKNAGVTIQLTDMAGRCISTINETGLSTGEHIVPVSTSELPSGDYLCILRTSGGDGIATKITVLKSLSIFLAIAIGIKFQNPELIALRILEFYFLAFLMTVQLFSSFLLSISLLMSSARFLNALFLPQSQSATIGSLSTIMENNSLGAGAAGSAAYFSNVMFMKAVFAPIPLLSSRYPL